MPFLQALITPSATSLTSTKSYPPFTQANNLPFVTSFTNCVKWLLPKSFGPIIPDGWIIQAFKFLFFTASSTYFAASAFVFAYNPLTLSGLKLVISVINSLLGCSGIAWTLLI